MRPMRDDPFADLSAAACDLLADGLRVRYCGVVALDDEGLHAASSEFVRLPPALRESTLKEVLRAVGTKEFLKSDARSSQLVAFSVDEALGGPGGALVFPETDLVVFAVPPRGRALDVTILRRAAASMLPMVYRLDDLRAERQELVGAHALLSHVEELAKVGGWEQAPSGGGLAWSDEIYAIHGLEPGGAMTMERLLELYPSPAREKLSLEMERAAAEGGGFELTTPITTPAGESRIVRTVGRALSGRTGGRLYGITQDVTRQLTAERRLWWAVNHDPVTGLPNRLLFEDRLTVAFQRAKRDGRTFALLIVEIDDLARRHAYAGFTVPDSHMMEIAGRIGTVTRESDTVARLSISEFAIILNEVSDRDGLTPALERLCAEIDEVGGEGVDPGIAAYCGVAYYPDHAGGEGELVRAAEMALARARSTVGEPIVVFDKAVADDVAERRQTILGRARQSLQQGDFVPYYQAQFDMVSEEVVGVEALVRWQTPDLILDAKDFAFALEDHEVGSEVGRQVLDAVIADLAALKTSFARPFRVSINASRSEVLRNDFLDTFLAKTRAGNLEPTDFIIEITEDVIIGVDDQALHDKVSYLVSSGVEFSLDDFGTGYASLIHITSFPVREVKIDKQFVFGIESDKRKRAIVKGIVEIARSLGLNVIAEGVETAAQREVLREVGCRYAQGYLYAYPMPFDDFVAMLKA